LLQSVVTGCPVRGEEVCLWGCGDCGQGGAGGVYALLDGEGLGISGIGIGQVVLLRGGVRERGYGSRQCRGRVCNRASEGTKVGL
jgi:hypothetical protein